MMAALPTGLTAQIQWSATTIGGGATGDFAPYMLGSWHHGKAMMAGQALLGVEAHRAVDLGRRFSWGAGAEALTGWSDKTAYDRYVDPEGWTSGNRQGPAAIWLQQLWATVKWRGVFITAGMKERGSSLVDDALSSGDLIASNNARPIPEVRAGFVDFQNIPFTHGWVQLEGCLSYGKMADSDYLRTHYNRYNDHIATGVLYTYKRWYFRTKPTVPLVLTLGAQCAGQFGGKTQFWSRGRMVREHKNPQNFKAFWDMFIPVKDGGDGYYEGSTLGSWDGRLNWTLPGRRHRLGAYVQFLWEDGSSLGRRNHTDGLYGLEYRCVDGQKSAVTGAVVEFIDFRDQSGPIHWAPGDNPGTTITTEATGADNYYNNTSFNAHANFGMAIGSPFVMSPVYNRDGYLQFAHNRTYGMHAAAEGYVTPTVGWRAAFSYAKAWATGRIAAGYTLHNTSAMLECRIDARRLTPGLTATAAMAFDAGSLRGNNFGAMVTVTYAGNLTFKR